MNDLKQSVREFVAERDWRQFHTPKNLAMALAVEAAEIMEHFQWLTAEESLALDDEKRGQVGEEIGDVLLYLIGLSDSLDLDPLDQARRKLAANRLKYPAEKVRGKALKYTEYPRDGESGSDA